MLQMPDPYADDLSPWLLRRLRLAVVIAHDLQARGAARTGPPGALIAGLPPADPRCCRRGISRGRRPRCDCMASTTATSAASSSPCWRASRSMLRRPLAVRCTSTRRPSAALSRRCTSPACSQRRDERDDAVRLRLQPFGQFADAGPVTPRETLRVQQQLVVQHRDAFGPRGVLAEAQEAPQPVAEQRQALERRLSTSVAVAAGSRFMSLRPGVFPARLRLYIARGRGRVAQSCHGMI